LSTISRESLNPLSFVVLALVGDGGAGAHDLVQMMRQGGPVYWGGAPSRLYSEPKRLAKLGYFAVAPLLFSREGDVSSMADTQQIISKVVALVPDKQVASDLDATVAWAKSTGKADTTKLGITGFCWGGRQVWLYTAHNSSLKAGVAWYGPLQSPPSELRPKNPIDLVNEINAPILGLYGGKDMGIPVAQIEQMRAALKAAGKPSEIVIYPDAGHGLSSWDTHPYRRGHRSLRDYHFGRLRSRPACHERKCGHSSRISNAHRGGRRRPAGRSVDPIFQWTVDSPRVRSVTAPGRYLSGECANYRAPWGIALNSK